MKKILPVLGALLATFSLFSDIYVANHDYLVSTLKGPVDPAMRMISFSYNDIRPTHNMQVITGPGTQFNYEQPLCWRMCWDNCSYLSIVVNFNEEERLKDWFINLKQLSSPAEINYSAIAIDLNGNIIADHFEPFQETWRIDHFKLATQYLREGENIITIGLQEANSPYWIENITISPELPANVWLLDFMGQ